jgi:hypothetical protein
MSPRADILPSGSNLENDSVAFHSGAREYQHQRLLLRRDTLGAAMEGGVGRGRAGDVPSD